MNAAGQRGAVEHPALADDFTRLNIPGLKTQRQKYLEQDKECYQDGEAFPESSQIAGTY